MRLSSARTGLHGFDRQVEDEQKILAHGGLECPHSSAVINAKRLGYAWRSEET